MSTRLSRRGSFVVGIWIVAMMVVGSPLLALANTPPDNDPGDPPGKSAEAPGHNKEGGSVPSSAPALEPAPVSTSDDAGRGNDKKDESGTSAAPSDTSGKGSDKKEQPTASTSTSPASSERSDSPGKGKGNSQKEPNPDPVHTPTPQASKGPAACPGYDQEQGGPYDHNNCDGSQGTNGNGGNGKCAGCTGKADDKSPGGQNPGDHNNGYECDNNSGVGKGNPAHSRCALPRPPSYDCKGHLLPNNHSASECDVPQYDCKGHLLPNNHSASECDDVKPRFDCLGHPLPNDHSADECRTPPPPPDCDGDGIDDNVDSDISGCKPVPPKKDCDGDGVPDDVDSDVTGCQPVPLCPDGTVVPANGKCDPSVLPDFVRGIRVVRAPAQPAVQPADVNNGAPAVAASLLPFTGGNLLPFLLVSAGLIGAGLPALRRRGGRS